MHKKLKPPPPPSVDEDINILDEVYENSLKHVWRAACIYGRDVTAGLLAPVLRRRRERSWRVAPPVRCDVNACGRVMIAMHGRWVLVVGK